MSSIFNYLFKDKQNQKKNQLDTSVPIENVSIDPEQKMLDALKELGFDVKNTLQFTQDPDGLLLSILWEKVCTERDIKQLEVIRLFMRTFLYLYSSRIETNVKKSNDSDLKELFDGHPTEVVITIFNRFKHTLDSDLDILKKREDGLHPKNMNMFNTLHSSIEISPQTVKNLPVLTEEILLKRDDFLITLQSLCLLMYWPRNLFTIYHNIGSSFFPFILTTSTLLLNQLVLIFNNLESFNLESTLASSITDSPLRNSIELNPKINLSFSRDDYDEDSGKFDINLLEYHLESVRFLFQSLLHFIHMFTYSVAVTPTHFTDFLPPQPFTLQEIQALFSVNVNGDIKSTSIHAVKFSSFTVDKNNFNIGVNIPFDDNIDEDLYSKTIPTSLFPECPFSVAKLQYNKKQVSFKNNFYEDFIEFGTLEFFLRYINDCNLYKIKLEQIISLYLGEDNDNMKISELRKTCQNLLLMVNITELEVYNAILVSIISGTTSITQDWWDKFDICGKIKELMKASPLYTQYISAIDSFLVRKLLLLLRINSQYSNRIPIKVNDFPVASSAISHSQLAEVFKWIQTKFSVWGKSSSWSIFQSQESILQLKAPIPTGFVHLNHPFWPWKSARAQHASIYKSFCQPYEDVIPPEISPFDIEDYAFTMGHNSNVAGSSPPENDFHFLSKDIASKIQYDLYRNDVVYMLIDVAVCEVLGSRMLSTSIFNSDPSISSFVPSAMSNLTNLNGYSGFLTGSMSTTKVNKNRVKLLFSILDIVFSSSVESSQILSLKDKNLLDDKNNLNENGIYGLNLFQDDEDEIKVNEQQNESFFTPYLSLKFIDLLSQLFKALDINELFSLITDFKIINLLFSDKFLMSPINSIDGIHPLSNISNYFENSDYLIDDKPQYPNHGDDITHIQPKPLESIYFSRPNELAKTSGYLSFLLLHYSIMNYLHGLVIYSLYFHSSANSNESEGISNLVHYDEMLHSMLITTLSIAKDAESLINGEDTKNTSMVVIIFEIISMLNQLVEIVHSMSVNGNPSKIDSIVLTIMELMSVLLSSKRKFLYYIESCEDDSISEEDKLHYKIITLTCHSASNLLIYFLGSNTSFYPPTNSEFASNEWLYPILCDNYVHIVDLSIYLEPPNVVNYIKNSFLHKTSPSINFDNLSITQRSSRKNNSNAEPMKVSSSDVERQSKLRSSLLFLSLMILDNDCFLGAFQIIQRIIYASATQKILLDSTTNPLQMYNESNSPISSPTLKSNSPESISPTNSVKVKDNLRFASTKVDFRIECRKLICELVFFIFHVISLSHKHHNFKFMVSIGRIGVDSIIHLLYNNDSPQSFKCYQNIQHTIFFQQYASHLYQKHTVSDLGNSDSGNSDIHESISSQLRANPNPLTFCLQEVFRKENVFYECLRSLARCLIGFDFLKQKVSSLYIQASSVIKEKSTSISSEVDLNELTEVLFHIQNASSKILRCSLAFLTACTSNNDLAQNNLNITLQSSKDRNVMISNNSTTPQMLPVSGLASLILSGERVPTKETITTFLDLLIEGGYSSLQYLSQLGGLTHPFNISNGLGYTHKDSCCCQYCAFNFSLDDAIPSLFHSNIARPKITNPSLIHDYLQLVPYCKFTGVEGYTSNKKIPINILPLSKFYHYFFQILSQKFSEKFSKVPSTLISGKLFQNTNLSPNVMSMTYAIDTFRNLISGRSSLVNLNVCSTSRPNVIDILLDLFPFLPDAIQSCNAELIELLGRHSISVASLKHLFRILQQREVVVKPLCSETELLNDSIVPMVSTTLSHKPIFSWKIIQSLQGMFNYEPGPKHTFVFDGINSGLKIPPIMKWPSSVKGISFCCWVRIESRRLRGLNTSFTPFEFSNSASSTNSSRSSFTAEKSFHDLSEIQIQNFPEIYNPYLLSLRDESGIGIELYFKRTQDLSQYRIVLRSHNDAGETSTLCPENEELKLYEDRWYFLGFSLNPNSFYSKGEAIIILNKFTTKQEFNFAKLPDSIPNPMIGDFPKELKNLSSPNEGTNLEFFQPIHTLQGQLGAIYFFSDSLTESHLRSIYTLGPDYVYNFESFSVDYKDLLPSKNSSEKANSSLKLKKLLDDGILTSRILLTYNPVVLRGKYFMDNTPEKNELKWRVILSKVSNNLIDESLKYDNSKFLFMHAYQLPGTYRSTTQDVRLALNSLGGIKAIIPFFAQIDQKPENDEENNTQSYDSNFFPAVLGLFTTMIEDSLENQKQFQKCGGFSAIRNMLEKSALENFNLITFNQWAAIYLKLYGDVVLQDSCLDNVLCNFKLWSKTLSEVQLCLFDWLIQTFQYSAQSYPQSLSINRLLDALYLYYDYSKSLIDDNKSQMKFTVSLSTLKQPIITSIRLKIFILMKSCITNRLTVSPDSISLIVKHLVLLQSEDSKIEILSFLVNILNYFESITLSSDSNPADIDKLCSIILGLTVWKSSLSLLETVYLTGSRSIKNLILILINSIMYNLNLNYAQVVAQYNKFIDDSPQMFIFSSETISQVSPLEWSHQSSTANVHDFLEVSGFVYHFSHLINSISYNECMTSNIDDPTLNSSLGFDVFTNYLHEIMMGNSNTSFVNNLLNSTPEIKEIIEKVNSSIKATPHYSNMSGNFITPEEITPSNNSTLPKVVHPFIFFILLKTCSKYSTSDYQIFSWIQILEKYMYAYTVEQLIAVSGWEVSLVESISSIINRIVTKIHDHESLLLNQILKFSNNNFILVENVDEVFNNFQQDNSYILALKRTLKILSIIVSHTIKMGTINRKFNTKSIPNYTKYILPPGTREVSVANLTKFSTSIISGSRINGFIMVQKIMTLFEASMINNPSFSFNIQVGDDIEDKKSIKFSFLSEIPYLISSIVLFSSIAAFKSVLKEIVILLVQSNIDYNFKTNFSKYAKNSLILFGDLLNDLTERVFMYEIEDDSKEYNDLKIKLHEVSLMLISMDSQSKGSNRLSIRDRKLFSIPTSYKCYLIPSETSQYTAILDFIDNDLLYTQSIFFRIKGHPCQFASLWSLHRIFMDIFFSTPNNINWGIQIQNKASDKIYKGSFCKEVLDYPSLTSEYNSLNRVKSSSKSFSFYNYLKEIDSSSILISLPCITIRLIYKIITNFWVDIVQNLYPISILESSILTIQTLLVFIGESIKAVSANSPDFNYEKLNYISYVSNLMTHPIYYSNNIIIEDEVNGKVLPINKLIKNLIKEFFTENSIILTEILELSINEDEIVDTSTYTDRRIFALNKFISPYFGVTSSFKSFERYQSEDSITSAKLNTINESNWIWLLDETRMLMPNIHKGSLALSPTSGQQEKMILWDKMCSFISKFTNYIQWENYQVKVNELKSKELNSDSSTSVSVSKSNSSLSLSKKRSISVNSDIDFLIKARSLSNDDFMQIVDIRVAFINRNIKYVIEAERSRLNEFYRHLENGNKRSEMKWSRIFTQLANERGPWGYGAESIREGYWALDNLECGSTGIGSSFSLYSGIGNSLSSGSSGNISNVYNSWQTWSSSGSTHLKLLLKRNPEGTRHLVASLKALGKENVEEQASILSTFDGSLSGIYRDLKKYKNIKNDDFYDEEEEDHVQNQTNNIVLPTCSKTNYFDGAYSLNDIPENCIEGCDPSTFNNNDPDSLTVLVEIVTPATNSSGGRSYGRLEINKHKISFWRAVESRDYDFVNKTGNHEFLWACKCYPSTSWMGKEIVSVYRRFYQLRYVAIEMFTSNRTSVFFNFFDKAKAKKVHQFLTTKLQAPYMTNLFPGRPSEAILRPILPNGFNATNAWIYRKISNFEYLMHLNFIAGRSFNDLAQYPIFPWVLKDYSSPKLDLKDPKIYRDFKYPIGAQNQSQRIIMQEKYESCAQLQEEGIFPYHTGSHYSTSAMVLWYLMRLEPFTSLHVWLQDGKFDRPDRLFHSIEQTFIGCTSNTQDVKELIPEFFCNPEFLTNINGCDFGNRQNGQRIHDVILPNWCKDANDFIRIHREALESEYVSLNLHHWIDLIFGYKQRPPFLSGGSEEAVNACNVFVHLSYANAVDLEYLKVSDPVLYNRTIRQIDSYGQTPSQLFTQAHPRRKSIDEIQDLIWPIASSIVGSDSNPRMKLTPSPQQQQAQPQFINPKILFDKSSPSHGSLPSHPSSNSLFSETSNISSSKQLVKQPSENSNRNDVLRPFKVNCYGKFKLSNFPILFLHESGEKLLTIDSLRVFGVHSFVYKQPDNVPPFALKIDKSMQQFTQLSTSSSSTPASRVSSISQFLNTNSKEKVLGISFAAAIVLSSSTIDSTSAIQSESTLELLGSPMNKVKYYEEELYSYKKSIKSAQAAAAAAATSPSSLSSSTSSASISSISSSSRVSRRYSTIRSPSTASNSISHSASNNNQSSQSNIQIASNSSNILRKERVDEHLSSHLFCYFPSGKLIGSCGHWDNTFKITHAETGKLLQSISFHREVVTCIASASDLSKHWLVVGSKDCTISVWEVFPERESEPLNSSPLHILYGHDDIINCIVINPELDVIVSGSDDGTIIINTLREGNYVRSITFGIPIPSSNPPPPSAAVAAAAALEINNVENSNKPSAIFSAFLPSSTNSFQQNKSHNIKRVHLISVSSSGNIAAYSNDGWILATYSLNGTLHSIARIRERLNVLTFSDDGKVVLTGGERGLIVLRWAHNLNIANTGPRRGLESIIDGSNIEAEIEPFSSPIRSLFFTNGERHLLVGLENGEFRILAQDSEYLRKKLHKRLIEIGILSL